MSIAFQTDCTILHSRQQHMGVLVVPYPCKHLVLAVFLILVILIGVYCFFIMILNYTSQMTNDVLIIPSHAYWLFYFDYMSVQIFCQYYIYVLYLPIIMHRVSTYILNVNFLM